MAAVEKLQPAVIRHILGDASIEGRQCCILCGVTVAPHVLGALPAGEVFERDGRLNLIEPLEPIVSCREQEREPIEPDDPTHAPMW